MIVKLSSNIDYRAVIIYIIITFKNIKIKSPNQQKKAIIFINRLNVLLINFEIFMIFIS